jgi:hypothetical protein
MVTFERVITSFESEHHCIFLEDGKGTDYSSQIKGSKVVLIAPDGKKYFGDIQYFYYKNRFVKGINCHYPEDETKSFIFEQSANPGHWVKLAFDPNAELVDGALPIHAEVYVKTK